MTNTIAIPLNKLLAWQGNVRKTDPDKGIDELRASISAHGLLQSLVVRKDKRGKYAVVAGLRRPSAVRLDTARSAFAIVLSFRRTGRSTFLSSMR